MKTLRQLSVLLALALAPLGLFGATVTGLTGTASYVDGGGNTVMISPGDTIPDGVMINLISGSIQVSGSVSVNTGNGISEVSNGEMLVEVFGDRARTAAYSGNVTFTPKGSDTPQNVAVGQEVFAADAGSQVLIIVTEINAIDIPGFTEIPTEIGTPT